MERQALYGQLAPYYDKFYWWKDYGREIDFLAKVFSRYGVKVHSILEVACGTGSHTKLLAGKGYRMTGVDINPDMLRVARRKLGKHARFIQGNMRDLQSVVSGNRYDAVLCLFNSISYNLTLKELKKTVGGMSACARPGGLVVFDTHFTTRGFEDGYRGEDIFDDGKTMGARLGLSKRRGNLGEISFSYLIYDSPKTIVLRDDVHRLGLFNRRDLLRTLKDEGLEEVSAFDDWSFTKERSADRFKDIIFVGRKPPR